MSISNQYFGKLDSEKAAKGMNLAIKNSQRLLEDSEILFKQDRYSSAVALAILSIEESGKLPILRGLTMEDDDKKIAKKWKSFRNHLQKNNLWILPDLASQGANTFDELKVVYSDEAKHPKTLNALKQISIYTEFVGKAKWTYPDVVITKEIAESMLMIAKILCPNKEITALELDLRKEYLKPVLKKDINSIKQAIIDLNEALNNHGLNSYDEDVLYDFIMGEKE